MTGTRNTQASSCGVRCCVAASVSVSRAAGSGPGPARQRFSVLCGQPRIGVQRYVIPERHPVGSGDPVDIGAQKPLLQGVICAPVREVQEAAGTLDVGHNPPGHGGHVSPYGPARFRGVTVVAGATKNPLHVAWSDWIPGPETVRTMHG